MSRTDSDEQKRRVLDVTVATLGLVVLSPLLALISFLIKLESPGPVLFKQTRVGKGEKPFDILKFRSMKVAAPDPLVPFGGALTPIRMMIGWGGLVSRRAQPDAYAPAAATMLT